MAMRGKSTRKKYDHAESVNTLFDKISAAAQTDPLGSEWLERLKPAALRKTAGWTKSIDAYLVGLAAAGHISSVELGELRASLALCIDSDATWSEFLYPLVWTACVAVVTLACRAISMDWWFIAAALGLMAVAGATWASRRAWLQPGNSANLGRWERPFVMGACALLVPLLTVIITLAVGMATQSFSIHRFNVDRMAFAADPQGFPMLRAFARKNFDVEVVLGDANDSWASTTVNLPSSSVASMSLSPGYCALSMYRDNVLRSFDPAGKQNQELWIQGVMMHEFGHCLDGLRDLPNFGEHAVRVHSIAPIDAKGVSDLQSYLAATEENTTKIWREALADTFAVGYWRLVAPGEAESLAASLRLRRSNAALGDSTHATMCWIDQAMHSVPPASEKDLFAWADHQRSVALCAINKPGKRISAFMKLKDYVSRLTIADNTTNR